MFTSEIKKSLVKVLKELEIEAGEEEIKIEHPEDLDHGDYSSNIALVLMKKQNKNPKELAEQIKITWQEMGLPDFVEKIEVAGPGFINIWLSFSVLSKQLTEVLREGGGYGGGGHSFAEASAGKRKTMVIDYSSPNIAKPFGIGHLRSTNIGQAIYNLYKYLGWNVIGDNHLGDWGTQFGKLICQIELKVKSSKLKVEDLTIEELEKLYIEFHKEAETKPELEEEARKWFKKLEEGDEEAKKIWQACVDISLKEFNRVYYLLGVKIDYAYGESFYQDKMQVVLDDCKAKEILKESQGAQVVELEGMEIPVMLVKSDGATTYLLRDLAAVKFRKGKWNPDLFVYEVGVDQTFHFQQLFKLCVLLGYGKMEQFVHIGHGLIRWLTGKFSTRRGETIHLKEVLNEAMERAKKLAFSSKNSLTNRTKQYAVVGSFVLPEDSSGGEQGEIEEIAKKVGIGAIKYNDLKQNPTTDIIFDWEQILTLSGNSGPYLQYTYARTCGVLANSKLSLRGGGTTFPCHCEENPPAGGDDEAIPGKERDCFGDKPLAMTGEETALLRTVYRFPEVVEEAAREFSPNLLCNFLFDLCQKFNLFYDKQRIIGSDNEQFRLLLTAAVGQVLKNGLALLGIEALERM